MKQDRWHVIVHPDWRSVAFKHKACGDNGPGNASKIVHLEHQRLAVPDRISKDVMAQLIIDDCSQRRYDREPAVAGRDKPDARAKGEGAVCLDYRSRITQ
ncbi:hypothetical protein KZX46_03635 (plasmid) [Polymorphobacter sp. PAMC 29334]|nr:hypothetical protein KZX46_03635 [Polymorphobacter sp. PAMC 29334]